MSLQTLAEVLHNHVFNKARALCLCGLELGGTGHRTNAHRTHLADAVTAHLAAILADPETVEAVARAVFDFWVGGDPDVLWSAETEDVRDMYRDDARAAIAVIAARIGLEVDHG